MFFFPFSTFPELCLPQDSGKQSSSMKSVRVHDLVILIRRTDKTIWSCNSTEFQFFFLQILGFLNFVVFFLKFSSKICERLQVSELRYVNRIRVCWLETQNSIKLGWTPRQQIAFFSADSEIPTVIPRLRKAAGP